MQSLFKQHRRLALIFIVLWSLAGHCAEPTGDDQYVIKVWGADDGLAEGSVTDVAQTPEGYLWVGTLFGSVLRFDGTRFSRYNSANTPEFTQRWGVPRFMVDHEGTLWISVYDGGLMTWDRHGFKAVSSSTNQPNRLVWSADGRVLFSYGAGRLLSGVRSGEEWKWETVSLPNAAQQDQSCADASGRVWYVRDDGAAGTWKKGNSAVPEAAALGGRRIKVLAADSQSAIWVGTDQGLACWSSDRFRVVTPPESDNSLDVKRIIPSGTNLWVEANGRMRRFAGDQWQAESPGWKELLGRRTSLRFVHGDSKGGLWSSAPELGLIHVVADGTLHRLTTRNGLPSDTVDFAFQDREGDTWTGYDRGGLVQVRHRLFHVTGREEGLADSLINTVTEDAKKRVWIGTHRGSVGLVENGVCTNILIPGPGRIQDSCAAADKNGSVWIGAQGTGLWQYNDSAMRQVIPATDFNGYARLIVPGARGRVWVGTLFSIFSLADGKMTTEFTVQTTGDHPSSLAEGPDGSVWAGTLAGYLLHRENGKFVAIEPPERNSLGRVWALWPTADGGVWAGTESGGLLHLHNGVFHRYTKKQGLPSDSIAQVLGDAAGNLWIGTRAGIARIFGGALAKFERHELDELPVSVYGQADGLRTVGSSFIYQPNCWHGTDGTLYFAMANSVAAVRPEEVRINPVPPKVVVESLIANESIVLPEKAGVVFESDEARKGGSEAATVEVPPGAGDLEIQYTGLSLASAARVRFRCKLDGLDKEWIDAGTERKAVYRHVPPGSYAFHVKAANSDSIWSEDKPLLTIVVRPFFYQTTMFRVLGSIILVAVVSGAVTMAYKRRVRRHLAEIERQHALERERSRIAQDLHDDLGAGLTEIGLLSGLLQAPANGPERKQEALARIGQRCRELVTALDEIVWAVNPRNDSVHSLCAYLSRYAQSFLQPAQIRCRLQVDEGEVDYPLGSEQRHNLFLAFEEALTNAVRHSNATEVRVKMGVEENTLNICIEDNGRGLANEGDQNGDGLVNLPQRLARIGGRCNVTSETGRGVTVQFHLPLASPLRADK